jgi:tRNA A58 N-methylase Trm61
MLADDDAFDALCPDWARRVARGNWTPLVIAKRAAQLLVARPGARVLDVGSGVGKVCIVGALTTAGIFHGVEQREHFVAAARAAAAQLELSNVRFTCANITEIDWRPYDAIYLFNPFAEYYGKLLEPFDGVIAPDRPLHAAYVQHVQEQLAAAAPGTRVVTFSGFGGEFPPGYRHELTEALADERLELWIKAT